MGCGEAEFDGFSKTFEHHLQRTQLRLGGYFTLNFDAASMGQPQVSRRSSVGRATDL